jgi:hypothetical protein
MSFLRTYPLSNSAILRLNAEKDHIQIDPWYQRNGDVWTIEKRQLLIDSILNDYDVPKFYFHVLKASDKEEQNIYDYAIIDGRQRLGAIWSFADNGFQLSEDFVCLIDPKIKAAGMNYSELSIAYPKLKVRFDSFTLPIICVETDDIELIEDMFSRLNEAVPLNAAEKRNAIGGEMADCIRTISSHNFFEKKVRFSNNRYQYREVSARLLFIEYSIIINKKIIDTKKPYLDDMVKKCKKDKTLEVDNIKNITKSVLDDLDTVFCDEDNLLSAQAVIPIFYLVMRYAKVTNKKTLLTRTRIGEFQALLKDNKQKASTDIASANFDLLEYDRMTQQGTNDAASIKERVKILCEYLGIFETNSSVDIVSYIVSLIREKN